MHYLFTDASQNYLNSNYTILAGVILDSTWTPILEFVVSSDNSHDFEKFALIHGLQLAKDAGITELRCFSDCLSTVRKSSKTLNNELVSSFTELTINYIPRRYNLYANALSRVPANVRVRADGQVQKAFEGVNRAKKYFFKFCHDGYFSHPRFERTALYNSAYSKFTNIIRELEFISASKRDIETQRLKSLIALLYKLFMEFRFEGASNCHDLLSQTAIQRDLYERRDLEFQFR